MGDAAKPVRPSKRDAVEIDGEEPTNDQPAVKREAETDPWSKVAELEQKLNKSEENFQRACRAARTAELRAEAAESRLDSKHGIKEGLDAEKKRADELEMKLAEVSRKNEILEKKMADMGQEHHDDLVQINHVLQQTKVKLREVHQYLLQPQVQARLHQQPYVLGAARVAPMLDDIGHPTNIFQLCRPSNEQTIPLVEAYRRMKAASVMGKKGFYKRSGNISLHCDLCEQSFTKYAIIQHFLSHYHKVKAVGAAVSRAAFQHWLEILKNKPAAAAATAAASDDDEPGPSAARSMHGPTAGARMAARLAPRPTQDPVTSRFAEAMVAARRAASAAAVAAPVGAPAEVKKEEVDE